MAGDRPAPTDPVLVGRVVKPHALKGEVVVEPETPASVHFEVGSVLWDGDAWRPVISSWFQGARPVVGLEGIDDRDAAEALRGKLLVVEADDLSPPGDGRYYAHDLVGCRVEDVGGNDLGEIVAVIGGPQDRLEVERDGARSLVPMVDEIVKQVDTAGRRVVIDPPAGLAESTRA